MRKWTQNNIVHFRRGSYSFVLLVLAFRNDMFAVLDADAFKEEKAIEDALNDLKNILGRMLQNAPFS